jgi:hypothetical protein
MDAKEWRKCTVAKRLVDEAVAHVDERRLRLLNSAFARLRWHKMEPAGRISVLALEEYLDGVSGSRKPSSKSRLSSGPGGAALLARACQLRDPKVAATAALPSVNARKGVLLPLIRCLLGNPFEPLKIEPVWLSANDGAVVQLARSVAAGGRERMPILADALEDAGCSHEELLSHLRSADKHQGNCWALEAILGAAGDPMPRLLSWPEGPRGHPDWPRAQIRCEQKCPRCRKSGPRTSHLLPGRTPQGNVFVRCVLCELIEWVTEEGLGDPAEATLRALEIVAAICPECGGNRRAFRARTQQNAGRAFLTCTDPACKSFEWADVGTPDMPKLSGYHED